MATNKEIFRNHVNGFRDHLQTLDSKLKGFTVRNSKAGHWEWIIDDKREIGGLLAHYELRVIDGAEYRMELHFEAPRVGLFVHKLFAERLEGKIKADKAEWFEWDKAKSIRYKQSININDEKLYAKLAESLLYLEEHFGNEVRAILKEIKATNSNSMAKYPLNQILYGPPGTGKTYNTINKALEILGLDVEAVSRPRVKTLFDEKLKEGRIVFTTFHQSMSYEDFIEGIKPDLRDEELKYTIEDGLFKRIVTVAKDNWLYASKGDATSLSFEHAFSRLKEDWEGNQEMGFKLKTEGSDFNILGFTNTSIHFKKSNGSTKHTLSINTLRDYFYNRRELKQGGLSVYYPAILAKLKDYPIDKDAKKEEMNYVLIIDEINRGNVSQIFGELITLIEEDKRLGKDEALEVTLPYSKERFGVPPNLYIIGTMNTADRSVEALDAALRRRFVFEEMPPKPELITNESNAVNGIINGINLATVLSTINNRIELLLDKDHQIGHSYFMKVASLDDLKLAFQKSIIPLLQEYFFGDYGKIGLVLGQGFVNEKENKKNDKESSFAAFEYDNREDFESRKRYMLVNVMDMNDAEFKVAIEAGGLNKPDLSNNAK